ncbi:hypothetical protein PVK06_017075 [Gossypium arboreum]|uniref:RNase H type-1 domain-containing protein n=1 Tax=Gossypium arboreum TaxID=29729 RepID=A0ABR0Q270_GOSAR|nr:hypothetical protein PVK06_017075 [Gossypium arboreum]
MKVSIWKDAWVPGSGESKVQYTGNKSSLNKVVDLIDSRTIRWKTDLIENTFTESKGKKILFSVVIRDENGRVIGSRTILHENISSVFTAEAMACLQAIRLGINLRLSMVKIEGDAQSVIRKLLTEEENRSEIEAYIEDSKRLCARFCSFVFRFTHKESNRVPPYAAE